MPEPTRLQWEIDNRPPCQEWEEEGDTSYCKNCGAQQAVHEPWIHAIFDWLESVP